MGTDEKLDVIRKELVQIRLVQVKQEENLREHMRRTEVQERSSEKLWSAIEAFKKDMDRSLRPLKQHVDRVQFFFAAVGVVAALAGIFEAAVTIWERLH